MNQIRTLIADDHPLMLRSLRGVLDRAEELAVVAEATSGAQVLPLVESTRPHVVVLDVGLPEVDGLSCLDRIVGAYPEVGVIMVSAVDDPRTVDEAAKRGARGYVVKTVAPEQLVAAVVSAAEAEEFVAVGLPDPADSDLTERELAVIDAVARGLSNKEIGRELWITEQTVKFHLGNIFRKLEVANRTEAARVAFDRGLGRTSAPSPSPERTPRAPSLQ